MFSVEPKELIVLTKAKILSRTIFETTEKSPKKFRHTFIIRMQNISLDIISIANQANEVFIDTKLLVDLDKSINALLELRTYADNADKHNKESKLLTLKLTRATTFEGRISKRIDLQFEAISKIKELDHLTSMAREFGAILPKQHEKIIGEIWDVRKLLGAWIKSERKRYNY